MTLHLLFTSQSSTLNSLKRTIGEQDAIMFVGDGVYALAGWEGTQTCYYRATDCHQRGLPELATATTIDDTRWVELCLQFPRTLSWKAS